MFQGKYEHALDEKGRLAIPSHFRKKISAPETEDCQLIVTVSDQCLAAYTESDWQKKIEQISRLNQLDPRVVAFRRIFVGCAQECPIDKAGRILLPADLRRDARIDKACILVGQLDKIEIWSAERWSTVYSQLTDSIGNICTSMSELGIHI